MSATPASSAHITPSAAGSGPRAAISTKAVQFTVTCDAGRGPRGWPDYYWKAPDLAEQRLRAVMSFTTPGVIDLDTKHCRFGRRRLKLAGQIIAPGASTFLVATTLHALLRWTLAEVYGHAGAVSDHQAPRPDLSRIEVTGVVLRMRDVVLDQPLG